MKEIIRKLVREEIEKGILKEEVNLPFLKSTMLLAAMDAYYKSGSKNAPEYSKAFQDGAMWSLKETGQI